MGCCWAVGTLGPGTVAATVVAGSVLWPGTLRLSIIAYVGLAPQQILDVSVVSVFNLLYAFSFNFSFKRHASHSFLPLMIVV